MPDFWPLIRAALPTLVGVLIFVGVIKFVAFVARRFRSMK
jgi:uncharacterized membrane protein